MAIEHKNAEWKPRASEQMFQAIFMAMDEGAVLRNGSGEIVAVNPAAENILGHAATELIGRSSADFAQALNFIREDEVSFPWELHPATLALQTGEPQRNVLMGAHRPDGTLVWISINAQPLLSDGESRPYGVVTTFRDVTERKRTEDALWFVAQRGWMDGTENFFDALAQYLGKTLGVAYVVIVRLDEDPSIAQTVALYARGTITANLRYKLKGTPCENVVGRQFCFYPQGIQQMFPEDALLAEMAADSYAGLPLWDSAGQPIGLIAVLDGKPLRDEAQVSQILQFTATRAAAELERERNDRMLRQSEQKFRTLAEHMPDNVVRHDRQVRAIYMNPALMASVAPEARPVLGESLIQTYPGNDGAASCQRVIEQVIATEAPAEVEFQLPNLDGEMRIHHVRYVAERDGNGEIVGALGIGRDITEHKKTERQLRQALEFTQGVINAIPDLLFEVDRDGTYHNVWARSPELLAAPKEVLLGKTVSDVLAPDAAEVALSAIREADEKGMSFGKVLRIDLPRGESWFELSVSKKPGADLPGHFVVLSRDITERKRMEDDIRRRELEFRTLAENMPDNVVRHDRQVRVQYFNLALRTSLPPEFMPVLGKSPMETCPSTDTYARYQHAIEQVIATGSPVELEFQLPNPRGEIRDHHVRFVAERDDNGEIVGALGIGRDITERKLAEKYEQFRSRTLELLSGGASLQDVLEGLARGVEQLSPGMICSILLLDSQGKRFLKGIGPSLPDSYNAGLDGLEIGIGVGSCGTAAATGERVIVEDIMTHPYWTPYKEFAAGAGLAACWSEPIRSSSGRVLGTFAAYHREVHSPAAFDISVIEKSTHLAGIAIERKQAEEALRASEQEFRTLAENLPDNLVRYDREGRRTYVNPALERYAAVKAEQMIGKTLRETNFTGMPMMETYQRALEHTLATGERSEFEMQEAPSGDNMRTHLCFIVAERAADGRISGAIAVGRDITERKRMEDEIRRSEQRFRTLAENLPDVLIRYDREGRRTYVNRALEQELAVSAEQMIGKTLPEANPTGMAMIESYQRALEHTLATGERSEFEVQIPLPGGNMRTGLCFIAPERTADGRIVGAISIARDITERKRMEYEIRRREQEFRSLAENSPDPIFRYDRDCRRIYANPASSVMSGHPVESLVGATPIDGQLLSVVEAAKLMTEIRQVFDSSKSGCVDLVAVDRDGKFRDYQMLLVPEQDEAGKVAVVLGLARDITAIRDAERRMTEFVASLPGFAYTFRLSPEGHASFPFVSPGIERLFGLKPEDVKDDWAPGLALTHPDDVPRILATMAESARTMTPYHVEVRVCRPGLPVRWIELRSVPLRQADGSVLWHGIMLDIDERKRNEAELARHRHHLEKLIEERTLALSIAKETAEAATRAKTHFLAAASHDLRQPLQAIRLFNDALTMTGLDEKQKRIGRNLSKAVNSLSELLNDLLDISRLDAGIIEPHPGVIQAEDLLGMIGAEFDALSREKNLSLNLFCPRRGLVLFSDDNLLLTLLGNLVSNAVKYTARGGVLVGIRQRGDRALIQVWDTGIGIAPEQMDSIFEEYFQIGNPERDRAKGVGLGLAIVMRLGKLLDIGVRVRSRVGRGSVFELSVPLANESDMHASPIPASATLATVASSRLAGKRIVVIEDDAVAAEALKLSLEVHGVLVTLFGTAEDTLASAEAIGADHYISDYRLPGMNGLQLLDAIQRNSAEPIKAVILTGNTSPDQIAIMQSSRWKVLFKPIGLPKLLSALDGPEAVH
jgi:PAS domain S-box-containing protein